MNRRLGLLVVAAALGGCGQNAPVRTGPGGAEAAARGPARVEEAPAKQPAWLSSIPPELKHDGFAYYGLTYQKPLRLRMTMEGQPPQEGEQTTTFKEMRDGKAIFAQTRTGVLSTQGSQEVSAEKDGVYVINISVGTLSGKAIELPATLAPGTTWKSTATYTLSNGTKLPAGATFKVVGPERVKTELGEFESLVVESKQPVIQKGSKAVLDSRLWLVKDIGLVKAVATTQTAGGPKVRTDIEAIR